MTRSKSSSKQNPTRRRVLAGLVIALLTLVLAGAFALADWHRGAPTGGHGGLAGQGAPGVPVPPPTVPCRVGNSRTASSSQYGSQCCPEGSASSNQYGTECCPEGSASSSQYGTECCPEGNASSNQYGTECCPEGNASSNQYGTECCPEGSASSNQYGTECPAPGSTGSTGITGNTGTPGNGGTSANGGSTGGSPTGPSSGTLAGGPSINLAAIARSLAAALTPGDRAAKIAVLLRSGGLSLVFKALQAGTLSIYWYYVPPGARLAGKAKPKPTLVAAGNASFKTAGAKTLKLRLTLVGRRMLRRARKLKLTARGTFTPTGGPEVTQTRSFVLRR